ncbi:antirestriction protein ArdA [Aeromonas allosaccharophila]|uniref:antirestriction protein ArdA n=1 Tax=Aeromonas allosaccharophila TaxID=656 RepID=UPI0030076681
MYQLNDSINNLKNTIALSCADLRGCSTRAQVQSINSFIASRKAELEALENQAFINRCVAVLDDAGTGEHNVYIYWFRIDYGCWLDAEEIVNAGGLADYLESQGMAQADIAELMNQDWDCQDAEGLASHCLHKYGSFDWMALEALLEVECAPDVLAAGLACEIAPEEIPEAYMGTWETDEEMAMEQWEEGGMLESVPQSVRAYIDWESVARDMRLNGEFREAGEHYFRAC